MTVCRLNSLWTPALNPGTKIISNASQEREPQLRRRRRRNLVPLLVQRLALRQVELQLQVGEKKTRCKETHT